MGAGDLMTLHAAWVLEQGQPREARPHSSMAKAQVARLLGQVLDDASQMHGGLGDCGDVPFGRWHRAARAARIAGGSDALHAVPVARDWLTPERACVLAKTAAGRPFQGVSRRPWRPRCSYPASTGRGSQHADGSRNDRPRSTSS